VPNFQDDDPYYPQEKNGVGGTIPDGKHPLWNEDDVRKVVQDEIDKISQKNGTNADRKNESNPNNTGRTNKDGTTNGNTGRTDKNGMTSANNNGAGNTGGSMPIYNGEAITEWFLPIVHFNIDSYKLRYVEYGNLASVAHVMKANPDLTIVVTGFTDKTASEDYNLDLSYKRAKTAIEHLVNVHGIPRSRLLLNYNGEDLPLVPAAGSTVMNRRVEFRVANDDDQEMENPIPISRKEGRKSGF